MAHGNHCTKTRQDGISRMTLTLREDEDKSVRLGGFDTGIETKDQVRATLTTTLEEIQAQGKTHRGERLMAAISEAGAMLSRRMEMEEIYSDASLTMAELHEAAEACLAKVC